MRYLGFPVHSVLLSFIYSIVPSHFLEFWLFQINYNLRGRVECCQVSLASNICLKNIMTKNIWKIFAPKRDAQIKLLFSTFFKVTVYLVHTQNQSYLSSPSEVSKNLCKYWSYLIQIKIGHKFLGVVYLVKKVSTILDENWSCNIIWREKIVFFLPWKWYENPKCNGAILGNSIKKTSYWILRGLGC